MDWREQMRATADDCSGQLRKTRPVGISPRRAQDSRWLESNDRLCGILGFSAFPELSRQSFQEQTQPRGSRVSSSFSSRLLANQITSSRYEKHYYRKIKALISVDLSVSLLHDARAGPSHGTLRVDRGRRAAGRGRRERQAAQRRPGARPGTPDRLRDRPGRHPRGAKPILPRHKLEPASTRFWAPSPGDNISLSQDDPEGSPFHFGRNGQKVAPFGLPIRKASRRGSHGRQSLRRGSLQQSPGQDPGPHQSDPQRTSRRHRGHGNRSGRDSPRTARRGLQTQADRGKDEFLATLAHELRNPLARLCDGLESLRLVRDDRSARGEVTR